MINMTQEMKNLRTTKDICPRCDIKLYARTSWSRVTKDMNKRYCAHCEKNWRVLEEERKIELPDINQTLPRKIIL